MKKHFKYILYFILTIVFLVSIALVLLTNQFFKFYNSYIEEEREEIGHQMVMVEWAIRPILDENNVVKLKKFCDDLQDNDVAIFVQAPDEKLIAASRNDIDITHLQTDDYSDELFSNYLQTLKNKMSVKKTDIDVRGVKYIVSIALLQDNMITTFLRNQQSIIFVFLIGIIIIIATFLYLILDLKLPFDKLQESATKIINGDMESEIYIIKKGMLSEHSKTINNMSKQLKQKIKELEELEIRKNEMLSGFSHEVKTPLTSMILASELLKSEFDTDSDCINIIKSNAERLNNLILNIIDIANLEHKTLNKNKSFSEFNLEDCIMDSIENIKLFAGEMSINFGYEHSVPVIADAQLIQTAIVNVLVNAIKYSKSEKVDIVMESADTNVVVRIKDYGIGIPQEHLDKIFDKFYRVDKNRSRELGGSGLGLSIVKEIVLLHGGSVELLSDNGCEVIITLPIE